MERTRVLLDFAMPDLDGLELCRHVRARGITVPIMVISALPGMDLPLRAAEAGADGFLRKPFENAELLERLRSWIEAPPVR